MGELSLGSGEWGTEPDRRERAKASRKRPGPGARGQVRPTRGGPLNLFVEAPLRPAPGSLWALGKASAARTLGEARCQLYWASRPRMGQRERKGQLSGASHPGPRLSRADTAWISPRSTPAPALPLPIASWRAQPAPAVRRKCMTRRVPQSTSCPAQHFWSPTHSHFPSHPVNRRALPPVHQDGAGSQDGRDLPAVRHLARGSVRAGGSRGTS